MKKILIILGILMSVVLSGCDSLIIAPSGGYCWTGSYCMQVSGGYDCGSMPYYSTKSSCESAQGAELLANNMQCSNDVQCQSGYCKPYGSNSFCENDPNPDGQKFIYCYGVYSDCTSTRLTTSSSNDCEDLGFDTNKPNSCYTDNEYCGNNKVEGVEECDGSNLRGYNCVTYGSYLGIPYERGTLKCRSGCDGFDTGGCSFGTPGKDCYFNWQCGSYQMCENNVCIDYNAQCEKDSDCDSGQECNLGRCQESNTVCEDACKDTFGVFSYGYLKCQGSCGNPEYMYGVILGGLFLGVIGFGALRRRR